MKKILSVLYIATLLFASCSDEYDDSALTGRVDNLENRVAKLEELCKQMNTNISSVIPLQELMKIPLSRLWHKTGFGLW